MSMQNLLQNLVQIGQRQRSGEQQALDLLRSYLRSKGIAYAEQPFDVTIPVTLESRIEADGTLLPCAGTSFVSGIIESKEIIISSAMPMAESPDLPNINFNPFCPAISRGNVYHSPAIAVSHEGLVHILHAKVVRGMVETECMQHLSCNLLVGNRDDPTSIVFTHIDSIGPGANDNASGVICVLDTISENPRLCETTLFVLAGAEELSTDTPFYWGAGYRRFEAASPSTFSTAKKILVIDSVGAGDIAITRDPRTIRRAFPLTALENLLPKTALITGDLNLLMQVYHSELDVTQRLSPRSLRNTKEMLSQSLAAGTPS